jgi:hypothetical protein
VGLTDVFVPEDLEFMRVTVAELNAANPRLVSLIAHDRVGFGAAVVITGLTALGCLWCSPLRRTLWETLAFSGVLSLTAAIVPHLAIGYSDLKHLAPALTAATAMVLGLALTVPAGTRNRGNRGDSTGPLPTGPPD